MEDKVREIVARIGEMEADFAADSALKDLGIDSYRAVEIIFELERDFEISIPDTRYNDIQTFSDLVALVRELRA